MGVGSLGRCAARLGFGFHDSIVCRFCLAWFEFSRTWVIAILPVDGVVGAWILVSELECGDVSLDTGSVAMRTS